MVPLALLCVGGLAVAITGPRVITRLLGRVSTAPPVLLRLWVAITTTSLVATLGSLMLSVVPGHGGVTALMALAHNCWSAVHDEVAWQVEATIGALTSIIVVVGAFRFIAALRRARQASDLVHDRHLRLQWILSPNNEDNQMWLPLDAPLAYSTAGHPGMVVISSGLAQQLDRAALDAVLAHEHAHINRGHHRAIRFADALAYAFPWLPIARFAPRAARAIVELEADYVAARHHGSGAVARALRSMHGVPAPRSALAIADREVEMRLARLEAGDVHSTTWKDNIGSVIATATAAAAPVLPLLAATLALMVASCIG